MGVVTDGRRAARQGCRTAPPTPHPKGATALVRVPGRTCTYSGPMGAAAPLPAVLGLIGNTPLVAITRFDTGPCTLLLKLESQNPGGSIKDRVGVAMIEAAEADGRLRSGGTVVEATAG